MKDINYLREIAQICIEELNAIDIYPNITANKFTINGRLKKTWGRCLYDYSKNHNCRIEIKADLLGDDVSEKLLRNTILHELLHACNECIESRCHHDGKWAEYAELVSDCYGMNIQQYVTHEELEELDDRKEYRYKCEHCGKIMTVKKYRAPKWYMHPHGYVHHCADGCKGAVLSEYYGFRKI